MATVTETIAAFFSARREGHNGPDLIDRWSPEMETQINVGAGKGEPVDGKRSTWTDGVREWHHIRIPKHADSEPTFNDYEMRWPLSEHAEAIGMTGWDWKNRVSRWCGFDFDAITGHAAGVGIGEEELEAVKAAAQAVPWVEVRRSTGGQGLHLYVYFEEGIPTANHTEHAALARAVLSLLSTEAAFDFASQIDACGGNMWVWHKKMTPENGGLSLVKEASRALGTDEIPSNWRDHGDVVSRKRKKVVIRGVDEGFESLATSRKFIPLDAKHKAIILKLSELGHSTIWISDFHLLQTHTLGLAEIAKDPDLRAELGIKGFFETLSSGTTAVNCCAFPLPDGAWKVCRYSAGVREAATWSHDSTYTTCYFNRPPSLLEAGLAMGGAEIENGGGINFATSEGAILAAAALGETVEIPFNRKTTLSSSNDGRLVVSVKKLDGDTEPSGWYEKGGKWRRVFSANTNGVADEIEDADDILRIVVTPSGESAGTFVASATGSWDRHTTSLAKLYLLGLDYSGPKADKMLGAAVRNRWVHVSLPFQSEYPGSRQWNRDAPQLAYRPADNRDNLSHPHWDALFSHTGQTLTPVLRELEWARRANVLTGADYLRLWFASIIQEPFQPLPYLFLHGPEKSGKTILWEAFKLLVTSGVVKADRVLSGTNEFNRELLGALLCVVEERNIGKTSGAAARIRDYVTATTIAIRQMRTDVFEVPNMTHWMQTSNELDAIRILSGDTRITAFYVPPKPPGVDIPKTKFLDLLREEGPAFTRTLLDTQLPPQTDRLRIPVIETEHKTRIKTMHSSLVDKFVGEVCFEVPGGKTVVGEFYARFQSWLNEDERKDWNKRKVLDALQPQFPYGPYTNNIHFVGNLKFDNTPEADSTRWRNSSGPGTRLTRE